MQPGAVSHVSEIFKFYCSSSLLCTYYSVLIIKPTYSLCNIPDLVSPTIQISFHPKCSHIADYHKSHNLTISQSRNLNLNLTEPLQYALQSSYHLPITLNHLVLLQIVLCPYSVSYLFPSPSTIFSTLSNISLPLQTSPYPSKHLFISPHLSLLHKTLQPCNIDLTILQT